MFEIIFLIVLALIFILFASIQDIKTTEISNWLSFGLILFALGFRFFYGLFSDTGFGFFYQGLIGLAIFFVLGNALYYGRVFAGGDAKLMIALGAILPFYSSFLENVKIFILFFVLFLFVGAIYGLVASIVFMIKNFSKFKKGFPKYFKKYKSLMFAINFVGLFLMVLGFEDRFLFITGILVFVLPYFYVYSKTIDDFCMVRKKRAKNLIEGDWLIKDVKIGKKLIKSSWAGLSKQEIKSIKKSGKEVQIKYGVVFAPVFFISFLLLAILYFSGYLNLLNWFLGF